MMFVEEINFFKDKLKTETERISNNYIYTVHLVKYFT